MGPYCTAVEQGNTCFTHTYTNAHWQWDPGGIRCEALFFVTHTRVRAHTRLLQQQTNRIHLNCMPLLWSSQGKIWLLMNNPISTWKVTSGWFQHIHSFIGEQFVFWMSEPLPECRATGAKWPLHHSFGNFPRSLHLSYACLSLQKRFFFFFQIAIVPANSSTSCWRLLFKKKKKKRFVPPLCIWTACTHRWCVCAPTWFSTEHCWVRCRWISLENLKIRISFEVLGLHTLHSCTTKPSSHRCRRVKEDSRWRATCHFFLL